MNSPIKEKLALLLVLAGSAGVFCAPVRAQQLDMVGATLLQTVTTNLNGAGIRVAQAEANNGDTNGIFDGANSWEVNPAAVGQPLALFTYTSALGTSTSFTNGVGDESTHADAVGIFFYGTTNQYSADPAMAGVATNVAHVDNYDANYFYNSIISTAFPANINDRVVNQSFNFTGVTIPQQQGIDSSYDDYAAEYDTLFISGIGNGGPVNPPGTCYNGIGVGAYQGGSSYGPTPDNGRAKPDITAPGLSGLTSFSTPLVSGAAAVLMQAGLRGDGGSDTNSAADLRMVKALLLNGAVKPTDWTNIFPSPLDKHYGAGVLNVFNSYEQLVGGKHGYIVSTSVTTNSPHWPTGASGTVSGLNGWDFNTNTSSATKDAVNHYYFNVTNGVNAARFTAVATLVWNRQRNETSINNLNLFLYNAANSNLVACSTSLVDNVEHIWLPQLPPGRYDLQVLKKGGTTVTTTETYALAFAFFSLSLQIAQPGVNPALAWPVYPAGFLVEATTNLTPPAVWETNDVPAAVVTNSQNYLLLNATNANEFFRLRYPDL